MKYDELGERMKNYEREYRTSIPKADGFIVLRLDGKAFHSYTRGLERPFDVRLMSDMDATCAYLCANMSGVKFGYVQSDEISLILPVSVSDEKRTELWYDGQVQKMVSVSAGMASAKLAQLRSDIDKLPVFDSRIFFLPNVDELMDYLRFRIYDAQKNSVTMAASTVRGHKELMSVSTRGRKEILEAAGMPVESLPAGFVNGRVITREVYDTVVSYTRKDSGETFTTPATRSRWVSNPAPSMRGEVAVQAALDLLG